MPSESLAYLFSLEQIGIKLGLDQIRMLVTLLGRPDLAYPCLVIAGTNGKGSVTAMVERALRAEGYRTGRYISPHLVRLEERVAIDGVEIDALSLDAAAQRIRHAASSLPSPPSFFEATTAMALDLFREARVDIAVLEVGLGGRLDATNVVQAAGVAITAIDFDHEQYLGHTIEAIALEKAGIIKPGIVAVLGRNPAVVQDVVRATCVAVGARFVYAPDAVTADVMLVDGQARMRLRTASHDYGRVTLALRGAHQVDNAIVAVRLLEELAARTAIQLSPAAIEAGLTMVEWPGRLELRHWRGVDVLLDGAHNPAGARALATYVRETYGRPLPFVVGAMKDKRIGDLISTLAPAATHFFCTAASSPRAAKPEELATVVSSVAPDAYVQACAPPMTAVAAACQHGSPVVVAGSLYLVGEVRESIT